MNDWSHKPAILAAARTINGNGSLDEVEVAVERLQSEGLRLLELLIDPLAAGWNTPVQAGHFRSGAAPVEALDYAIRCLSQGTADAVLLSGEDQLKSGYRTPEGSRRALMNIYGDECTLPQAYTMLALEFICARGITVAEFKRIARDLFENYAAMQQRQGIYRAPDERWFSEITELFRGVDCANPCVDFSGKVLVGSAEAALRLHPCPEELVHVLGTNVQTLSRDGLDAIPEISRYAHLKAAFDGACASSGTDFVDAFLNGKALLEVYTCFPVVPMAFLLASGLAATSADISNLLADHEVTVTGGMNLAGAPWNNPVLNALIAMHEQLKTGPQCLGCVHGNGGLGYKQGVAILGKAAPQ